MKWTRPTADGGRYEAGPYVVENLGRHGWRATGPGVSPVAHDTKADAQAEADDAALERISGHEADCEPVIGDHAEVLRDRRHDRRGRITAIIQNSGPSQRPIYCIRFNVGGGRTCLYRHEFEVMFP